MTLSSYELNSTYQKTSLQYEAKITPIKQNVIEEKNNEESNEINNSLLPIVYTNENSLSNPQKFQKILMEKILGSFNQDSNPSLLFPNENTNVQKGAYQGNNPYTQNSNSRPQGLYYSSSSEYYEKTTIEFSAHATIKTPSGEYNIEINFSYTKEFYERNETQIAISNEQFRNQFEIKLDKDDDSLKDLKSMHFIFDIYKEEKKDKREDIFEQLRELLIQRRETIIEMFKKSEDKDIKSDRIKALDNFQVWQENSMQEMNLVSVQKDGIGIFLANSSSESTFLNLNIGENGYSFQASYSKSETTNMKINVETKE